MSAETRLSRGRCRLAGRRFWSAGDVLSCEKGRALGHGMAVVVQEMVRADKSGVLFTIDPIRKRRDRMVIEAVFGLGEGIVSGEITPDHYVVERETGAVVEEFISVQPVAVTYDAELDGTRHVELSEAQGAERVLDGDRSSVCDRWAFV